MEYTKEHYDLAIAWYRGEIRGAQVTRALGMETSARGSLYNFLSVALKKALIEGYIKLEK